MTDAYIAPAFRAVSGAQGRMTRALYALLEEQFDIRIKTVHQAIRAVVLDKAAARRLDVKSGSAGLRLERRYLDARKALVDLAISAHPADRFTYRASFRRAWPVPAQKPPPQQHYTIPRRC